MRSKSNKSNHFLNKHEIYHCFRLTSLHSQARLDFNDQQGESGLLWNQIMKWYSKQKCDASNTVVNTERCIKWKQMKSEHCNLDAGSWWLPTCCFYFHCPLFSLLTSPPAFSSPLCLFSSCTKKSFVSFSIDLISKVSSSWLGQFTFLFF